MSTESTCNLHKIISLDDLKIGLKKLNKKNKSKHPRDVEGVFLRFINKEQKIDNALAKFLKEINNKDEIQKLYKNLNNYSPAPYTAYAIPKGSKKKFRPLLVPEPRDRLIFDSLFPFYKTELQDSLKKRGLLGLGLEKGQKIEGLLEDIYKLYILKGYTNALKLDYSSFFSKINREILFKKLSRKLKNEELFKAIKIVINNEIINGESVEKITNVNLVGIGIPQGLSFSPLLACYYALDIDDKYINNVHVIGFRYIDDVLILSKSKKELYKIYEKIQNLSSNLKMEIHKLETNGKTQLVDLKKESIIFLGAEFTATKAIVPESAFIKYLDTCKNEVFHMKIMGRKKPEEIEKVFYEYTRGWLNYYRDIYNNDKELTQKLNLLLYENYFKKKKERLKFYNKHHWIILNNNIIKSTIKK